MIIIHGIEDHLVKQIFFKGIGCFIEDFIEQAHQFGNIDERKTGNISDRRKVLLSHSKVE